MFPTRLFETATQRKILRVLAEKNKRYTIAELAELCHRSEASISRALQHADRYPFIDKDRVHRSKQLTFRLDPGSPYTAAIREFFDTEYNRERQNGMIPVDIWNLLEDVTGQFEDVTDGFVELFLFGSYATGDYYAGSDVDLLLVHTDSGDVTTRINRVVQKVGDERLQVIPVQLPADQDTMTNEDILGVIHERSPVSGVDVVVPLAGEVSQ